MTFRLSYLQACEVDDLPRETPEGVRVLVGDEPDDMGFPRVDIEGPTVESVVEFVREHWGEEDPEWFAEYVVDRITGPVPENAHWFMDKPLLPSTKVTCPECGVASVLGAWEDCEPGCEDCGNHAGIKCPSCEHWFDHVWDGRRFP